MKIVTWFSGGGGYDAGAIAAGATPIAAVEYEASIAAVYRQNFGDHITVASILDLDVAEQLSGDLFHVSPPCPNFSNAKAGGIETENDIALANKIADYTTYHKTRFFTLENVIAYRNSQSWAIIAKALHDNGYNFNWWHVNMADYGVPQTRKRMIVVARRDGKAASLPPATHTKKPKPTLFGNGLQKWIGWYEAVEDLIPTLPDSQFAPWQLDRLPEEYKESLLVGNGDTYRPIVDGGTPSTTLSASNGFRALLLSKDKGEYSNGHRAEENPAQCVTANDIGRRRAFIVNGTPNDNGPTVTSLPQCDPVFTMKASGYKRPLRAFIMDAANPHSNGQIKHRWQHEPTKTITSSDQLHRASIGRVVKMTPRALARFQSFPDWYQLPECSDKQFEKIYNSYFVNGEKPDLENLGVSEYAYTNALLACRIIGNAVPPLFAEKLIKHLKTTS